MQHLILTLEDEQQERKFTVIRYYDNGWVNRVLQQHYNNSGVTSPVFVRSETRQIRRNDQRNNQPSQNANTTPWNLNQFPLVNLIAVECLYNFSTRFQSNQTFAGQYNGWTASQCKSRTRYHFSCVSSRRIFC